MNELENRPAAEMDEAQLNVIAAEIRVIQEHARTTVLFDACEIGKRLLKVKCGLPHGRFTAWLKDNVEYSERQAQQMMALYEEYGKNGNPQTFAGLNVSQAVVLLAAPEDVRARMIESGEAESMSVRALQEEIKRQKAELESRQLRIDELETSLQDEESRAIRAETGLEAAEKREKAAEQTGKQAVKEKEEFRRRAEFAEREKGDLEKKAVAAEKQITDLEKQLSEARAVEKVVEIETVPPDVEQELEYLRRLAREAPDKSVIMARDAYRRGIQEFESLLSLISEMNPADESKYRAAFSKGLRMLADRMEAGE